MTTLQLAPSQPQAAGPTTRQLLANIRRLRHNPLSYFSQLQQTYGDVVPLSLFRRRLLLVSDADVVKHVLQDNNKNYTKLNPKQAKKTVVGRGLLTSEGDFWRHQRRLAQPAFHRQHLAAFADIMVAETVQRLEKWVMGRPLDIAQEMMTLTLDIVTKTLFSATLTADELQRVGRAMPFILQQTRSRLMRPTALRWQLPLPSNRLYNQHVAALDDIIYRLIDERLASTAVHTDLLGLLIAVRDADTGASMSRRQLRDEAMTIFLAGHETTANLLAWAWVLLGQHTAVRNTIYHEVAHVLQGRRPTAADYPQLIQTQKLLQETLRLYPPAWVILRTALADDAVRGHHIPAGTTLLISPYLLHHHPHYWHNPTSFDLERGRPSHKFAFIPFGAGPRLCIGKHFALMEATLIIATIAQRFDLHLLPNCAIEPETAVTLRPKYGVQAIPHPI